MSSPNTESSTPNTQSSSPNTQSCASTPSPVSLADKRPIIISGPYADDTGRLVRRLKNAYPGIFSLPAMHTTRPQRPNETEGVSNFFVGMTQLAIMKSYGEFIHTDCSNGCWYGTSRTAVAKEMDKGLIPILDIGTSGIKRVQKTSKLHARYVRFRRSSFDGPSESYEDGDADDEESADEGEGDDASLVSTMVSSIASKLNDDQFISIVSDDIGDAYKQLEEFVFGSMYQGQ
ncbi:putative guanylate kinase [Fusarium austroafricanum]|uniref:Putative guanylate kinase n=1 Tax=Fusarium austroafricanum TaxID=2364996 RepID=A0A8H4KBK6_9HYPO|nr:putative guanylate kinase [Fusarium austroafricanum]